MSADKKVEFEILRILGTTANPREHDNRHGRSLQQQERGYRKNLSVSAYTVNDVTNPIGVVRAETARTTLRTNSCSVPSSATAAFVRLQVIGMQSMRAFSPFFTNRPS